MNKHLIQVCMRQIVLYMGIAVALAAAGCQQNSEEPANEAYEIEYGGDFFDPFTPFAYVPEKSTRYFGDGADIESLHALVFDYYDDFKTMSDHIYESETTPNGKVCKHMHHDVEGDTVDYYKNAVISITASVNPAKHKSRLAQLGFTNIEEIEDSLNSSLNKRFKFLVDAIPDTIRNYDTPCLTAYFDEGFSVTADKTLFGREPGTDLTDKFMNIALVPAVVGLTNPVITSDFDNYAGSLSKFIGKNTWYHSLYLMLKSNPQERYPEITFNFTIPLIQENMLNQVVANSFGRQIGPKYTSVTYRNVKCTVRLKYFYYN